MIEEREGSFVIPKKKEPKKNEPPVQKRKEQISACIRIWLAIGIFLTLVLFDQNNITISGYDVQEIESYLASRTQLEACKKEVLEVVVQIIESGN